MWRSERDWVATTCMYGATISTRVLDSIEFDVPQWTNGLRISLTISSVEEGPSSTQARCVFETEIREYNVCRRDIKVSCGVLKSPIGL